MREEIRYWATFRELKEELLDAAAYSWRGGLKSLAIYLLDVANAVGKRRRHHPKCEWDDCQGGCWDLFEP